MVHMELEGYRHHRPRNPCACHAKRIISNPLQIHHTCQRFWRLYELLHLSFFFLQRIEILALATRNALFQILFKSTMPANVLASSRTPVPTFFCNISKSLCLPREKHFQPPKTSRAPGILKILISKSLSRAGVVQILRSSISKNFPLPPILKDFEVTILVNSFSKSAPNPRDFNDFDFQIALARRRGANFIW